MSPISEATTVSGLRASAIVPASDLTRSIAFFEETLGMTGEPAPGGHVIHCGEGTVIYLLDGPSYAGQAAWPLASFATEHLDEVVDDLIARGITLEQFADGPQRTDARGIADMGAMRIAWFRDPDRQVFSIFELRSAGAPGG